MKFMRRNLKNKIKVVHLLQSSKYSGAENVVCQIISLFKESEYEMVYLSPSGEITNVLKEKGIHYYSMNNFSYTEVKKAIEELNPHIVHAHDFSASIMAGMLRGRKIISHIHCNPIWLRKKGVRSILYSVFSERFSRIIGVSDSILEEYVFGYKIQNKFLVLSNVVDSKKVIENSKEQAEKCEILFVGRLEEVKNPIEFIEIVKLLHEKGNKITANIVGDGVLKNKCQELIKNYGLEKHIRLLGFKNNPYKYMERCRILVNTSLWEGFGIVAVEAMILGKPIVCSDVGGLKNIVDASVGALCKNREQFVRELLKLLTDMEEYEFKSKNAKCKAIEYCDLMNYKRKLESMYVSCVVDVEKYRRD